MTALLLLLLLVPADRPANLVLLIADGYGPASHTLGRLVADRPLALDGIRVGTMDTAPAGGLITDSAAAATALACGRRTVNGAIATSPGGRPLATLLEAAEERGMATGLVTSTRVTHATPACFAAHVPLRELEAEIARQIVAHDVEVVLGGGARFFRGELLEQARAAGYATPDTAAGLAAVSAPPVLGLFADSHLSYEIDRRSAGEPGLPTLAAKALELLAPAEGGFLLVIEAGRIDHAGHQNDPFAHVREVLVYDEVVRRVLDFARADGETLVVATADHETGGVAVGAGYDEPRLDLLARARGSIETAEERIEHGEDADGVLAELFGLDDLDWNRGREPLAVALSRAAGVGWTTLGHTGVDVGLFASGPGAAAFAGHHGVDEVGRLLAAALDFDLEALTERLP